MNGLIPAEAGNALARGLKEAGAKLIFSDFVQHIEELEDGSLCASLNKGQKIPCDLVISAIGLRPNIKLAEQAGIACNQGIQTNDFLETSVENIFALGDCAEISGEVRLYVLPLMASARALAKTLTGDKTKVNFGVMPIVTKTPVCPVITVPPPKEEGTWFFDENILGLIGRFKNTSNSVSGFVLTGDAVNNKADLIKELS
jgi:rubredoxin-NAD+ reductase